MSLMLMESAEIQAELLIKHPAGFDADLHAANAAVTSHTRVQKQFF